MVPIGDAVASIGVFDGLHVGHRFLIGSMLQDAKARNLPSVIVTFDRDPDEVIKHGMEFGKLMRDEERIEALASTGAQYVLVLPFTERLAHMPYRRFLDVVLRRFMHPVCLHVGADFKCGANAGGNIDAIRRWGRAHGCACRSYELVRADDAPVHATSIRELLAIGQVERAARLLGRDYSMRGMVVHGRGQGAGLGFATVNIVPESGYVRPADGVYAGHVECGAGRFEAAISLGRPLTFEGVEATLEAHLLDFSGDLYGAQVRISFAARLRDMQRFDSVGELKRAVSTDITRVRSLLNS